MEKIKELKEQAELKEQVETEKKEKKTRSSYRSKKAEAEQREAEFKQSISGVGSFALDLVVQRLPYPKPLTSEERNNFDLMFTKVAFKYSALLGSYQEEAALISILVLIIIPRLEKVKSIEEKSE